MSGLMNIKGLANGFDNALTFIASNMTI